MFHLVSLSLQISLTVLPGSCLGLCVCALLVFVVVCWVGCWFLSLGKFVLNHRLIPVVDRPCLALVRQCRKKKSCFSRTWNCHFSCCCKEPPGTRILAASSQKTVCRQTPCLVCHICATLFSHNESMPVLHQYIRNVESGQIMPNNENRASAAFLFDLPCTSVTLRVFCFTKRCCVPNLFRDRLIETISAQINNFLREEAL